MGGLVIVALVPFILSSCAPFKEIDADISGLKADSALAQKKDEALAQRLDVLQASLNSIDARLKEYPDKDTLEALRDSQTGLLEKAGDLLKEFQALSGRFDENKFQLDKAMKQNSADVELLRSKVESPESRVDAAIIAEIKTRLDAMEADLVLIKGKVAIYDEVLKQPAPVAVVNAPAVESAQARPDPQASYDAALKGYNDKKYAEARELLKDFLKASPEHKLASNARFWIGETFYAEGAYDDAILAYEEVIQRSPDSPKVPDAMLKQAYAFIQLGDKKAARGILGALIEKFPKHKLADSARKKLDTLK